MKAETEAVHSSGAGRARYWWGAVVLALATGVGGYMIARFTAPPVPVSAASEETSMPSDVVALEDSYLDVMGIAVERAQRGSLASEVLAPAAVVAAPNGEAVLSAQVAGTVSGLEKRLGDDVKAGDVLARIDSRDAAAIAADRAVASSKAELARTTAAREKHLFEMGVTPRQDYEVAQAELAAAEAEARRANAAADAINLSKDGHTAAVTSPLTGRVTAVSVTLGAYVQPDAELFRVADPRFVQINASVTVADARRIAPNDQAVITTSTDASLPARVVSVTPTLNAETRSATVVLALTEDTGSLRPGEIARARITPSGNTGGGLIVPDEAIQVVNGRDAVFVRTPDGFRVRPVTVGGRSGGRAEVLSGLDADDEIATRNAFLLKAELGAGAGEDEE